MSKLIRVYWDANAWIAYINQEESIDNNGSQENRFSMCHQILELAEKGKIEIATSTFTLAEVYKPKNIQTSPLDNLPNFLDKSYILMIDVDKAVGINARSLLASGEVNLSPQDAIHIASAQRASAKELHTFDKQILNHDGKISGFKGAKLKICKPTEGAPMPLFDEQNNTDDENQEDIT
ncbi:MAG: type II toxin-antitoxin system VapC family toxin [Proteobacteria bacterium]|nr:type II toxin-antitoxin system VapC family toxin [Pseudomonadota bacterium]